MSSRQMVDFFKSWFSKTERSFYTAIVISLVIFKLDDIYPNPVTYGFCAIITGAWILLFLYQMYKLIKNRNK